MEKIKKYLWYSQASLFILLIICCLIKPSVVVKNGGVSNFGNYKSTLILYVLSFSLSIIFLLLASRQITKNRSLIYIARLLQVMAGLEFLVLVSTFPRHISFTYSDIHDYIGIALFAYEFFLAIWFIVSLKKLSLNIIFAFQVLGSIIGLLSILKIIHFLFFGQLVGAMSFGLLLILSLPVIIARDTINND
jgi:succinate-acetate transporter protein